MADRECQIPNYPTCSPCRSPSRFSTDVLEKNRLSKSPTRITLLMASYMVARRRHVHLSPHAPCAQRPPLPRTCTEQQVRACRGQEARMQGPTEQPTTVPGHARRCPVTSVRARSVPHAQRCTLGRLHPLSVRLPGTPLSCWCPPPTQLRLATLHPRSRSPATSS